MKSFRRLWKTYRFFLVKSGGRRLWPCFTQSGKCMDNLRINKIVFRIATTDLIRKLFSGLFLHRYVRAVKYQKCSRYPDHKKIKTAKRKGYGDEWLFFSSRSSRTDQAIWRQQWPKMCTLYSLGMIQRKKKLNASWSIEYRRTRPEGETAQITQFFYQDKSWKVVSINYGAGSVVSCCNAGRRWIP